MPHTNFWIATVSVNDGILRMTGHNREGNLFEISASRYIPNGPVDFDNEKWDEGSFLVWDGNELWHIEATLSLPASPAESDKDVISDDEFRYDEYGLSPIVFSQITGAIVANL